VNTTFIQLRECLSHIGQIHKEVADISSRANVTKDGHAALLVDFFRDWERRLSKCYSAIPEHEQKAFLNSWIQYAGNEDVESALARVREAEHSQPEELTARSLELQEQILAWLRELADYDHPPEVRERLRMLADYEEKATRDLSVAIVTERDA